MASDESESELNSIRGGDSSSGHEERGAADQVRPNNSSSSDGEESEEAPPPIPSGFEPYGWNGQPVRDFLLWSSFGKETAPRWHVGLVTKVLDMSAQNKTGFTHDAKFDGERYPRGTTLREESVKAGTLVLLRRVSVPVVKSSMPVPTSLPVAPQMEQQVPASRTCSEPSSHLLDGSNVVQRVVASRHPKRAGAIRKFMCACCKSGGEFLYCDPQSPDAQCPTVRCVQCAPSGWVTISFTDFARACALEN